MVGYQIPQLTALPSTCISYLSRVLQSRADPCLEAHPSKTISSYTVVFRWLEILQGWSLVFKHKHVEDSISPAPISILTFTVIPRSSPDNAKLSSLTLQRTISFQADTKRGPERLGPEHKMSSGKTGRRRRSSSIIYHEPPESLEHISDQSALPNLNSQWVNAKGAWTIHFVLLIGLKILFDIIPGVTQEISWTLTNISYMFGSYLMFHYVRGVPFEFNAGAYDNLNMWEQIDNGDQYTPAKKFLLSVPILLFLLSTHYTHYDLTYFLINFLALMAVVIPKLPWSHRVRVGFFSPGPDDT